MLSRLQAATVTATLQRYAHHAHHARHARRSCDFGCPSSNTFSIHSYSTAFRSVPSRLSAVLSYRWHRSLLASPAHPHVWSSSPLTHTREVIQNATNNNNKPRLKRKKKKKKEKKEKMAVAVAVAVAETAVDSQSIRVMIAALRSKLVLPGEVVSIKLPVDVAKRIVSKPGCELALFFRHYVQHPRCAADAIPIEEQLDVYGVLASVLHVDEQRLYGDDDSAGLTDASPPLESEREGQDEASKQHDDGAVVATLAPEKEKTVDVVVLGLQRIEREPLTIDEEGESVMICGVEAPDFSADDPRVDSYLGVLLGMLHHLAIKHTEFNRLHGIARTIARFKTEFAAAPLRIEVTKCGATDTIALVDRVEQLYAASRNRSGIGDQKGSSTSCAMVRTKESVLLEFLDFVTSRCQLASDDVMETQHLIMPISIHSRLLSLCTIVRSTIATWNAKTPQDGPDCEHPGADKCKESSSPRKDTSFPDWSASAAKTPTTKANARYEAFKKRVSEAMNAKPGVLRKYEERLEGKDVPESFLKVIEEEMKKLSELGPQNSEYTVISSYLDWLTSMPFGVYSQDHFDVKRAQEVLDRDHFGLADVKTRILEFVAVSSIRNELTGKILCFVGPPGTGKTSIGKSIAHALGREFARFSVGGLADVSEIKGHRRTYVAAMPGKIIQTLKRVKTVNPVIMIDEIDKLPRGYRGDPAAALLEVLDPSQNDEFIDHFIDIPFDLSKTLFLCTANTISTIHPALLDRMEVIDLAGYVLDEKLEIAQRYLIPKVCRDHGLGDDDVRLSGETLRVVINAYCRELGIRSLERVIEQIYRKAALKIVTEHQAAEDRITAQDKKRGVDVLSPDYEPDVPEPESPIVTVTEANMAQFITLRLVPEDDFYRCTPVGVVTGLATNTLYAGSVLYVETVLEYRTAPLANDGTGNGAAISDGPAAESSLDRINMLGGPCDLRLTGHASDVLKESAAIGLSVARRYLAWLTHGSNRFFDNAVIRCHMPYGSVPKDGPSAGIAFTTALLSLALNTPAKHKLAMTGEITLHGKLLSIGGVRGKVMGMRMAGMDTLILPEANRPDWEALEDFVREGITVHFATDYADVFKVAFERSSDPEEPHDPVRKSPFDDAAVILTKESAHACPM